MYMNWNTPVIGIDRFFVSCAKCLNQTFMRIDLCVKRLFSNNYISVNKPETNIITVSDFSLFGNNSKL